MTSQLKAVSELSAINDGDSENHAARFKTMTSQISLSPSLVARVLGTMALGLILLSLATDLFSYLILHDSRMNYLHKLFLVDQERNIPTFFSQLLLLAAALLLALIALLKRVHQAPQVVHWAILSLGFAFMALDEAFSYHEKLIGPVLNIIGNSNLGIFYFGWVIPGLICVILLIPVFFKFIWGLPPKTRGSFVLAFAVYVGGAIGFEMLGGRWVESHGFHNLTYRLITTVEESLEMFGVIIFIWALLVYLADTYKEIRLRFDDLPG